jgi:hypothetical protein
MPKAYSADMRGRVIAEVEGGASRLPAAEWAAFKQWDASKGHDTNYNEYGWATT